VILNARAVRVSGVGVAPGCAPLLLLLLLMMMMLMMMMTGHGVE